MTIFKLSVCTYENEKTKSLKGYFIYTIYLLLAKNNCPDLEAPNNGGFVCSQQYLTNTERCRVRCNDGFEHVQEPNYYEECGPSTNWMWSHTIRVGSSLIACEGM